MHIHPLLSLHILAPVTGGQPKPFDHSQYEIQHHNVTSFHLDVQLLRIKFQQREVLKLSVDVFPVAPASMLKVCGQ